MTSESETEARFRVLVESPLRAGLLRFLIARPGESFEPGSLMAAFGRLRLDVDNCLRALVEAGLAQQTPTGVSARRPEDEALRPLLESFLERRATVSAEDQSPSVQRFHEMVGRDEKMLVVFESIRTAAKSDVPVLIVGPIGSGQDVVSRMIHELSRRGHEHFQTVTCAAWADPRLEPDVPGDKNGASTRATLHATGPLEMADRGTLFLDEVGDLPLMAQATVLRVLEGRRVGRAGSRRSVRLDVRLISATSRPLDRLVASGAFREDLYDRVNAFQIRLPSLRERGGDIPVLATRVADQYCAAHGLPPGAKVLSPDALARLQAYPWPGNIPELESTVSRAALSSPGTLIRDADITFVHPSAATARTPPPSGLRTLADAERAHIQRILTSVAWNKKEAAHVLQISRGTLYRKIFEYNLEREAPSAPETPGDGSHP